MPNDSGQPVQPRPLWQILVIGLLVGGWLVAALAYWHLRFGRSALPIDVSIRMDGPSDKDAVKLAWEFRRGGFTSPRAGVSTDPDGRTRSWEIGEAWVTSLLLTGEPAVLGDVEAITVRVGNHVQVFPRNAWQAAWKPAADTASLSVPTQWEVRALGPGPATARSKLGSFARVMNYPGDAVILRRVFTHPVVLSFLGLWLFVLVSYAYLRRKPVKRSLLDALASASVGEAPSREAQPPRRAWAARAWWLGGLAVLVACLALLETPVPYHFTQDDNYFQFLPGMLYGCRAAFDGSFPAWNPHQFLGAPLAEVGTYALTYPLTYVAYAIARFALGNEYATLEWFCLVHLIGGYCAFSWFGHRLGLAPAVYCAAALSFALSGYALVAGSFWFYMTPTFLWVPLLGVSVLSIARSSPGWHWVIGTGMAVGLYFHAGNVQMWTYGTGFFSIALLWACLSAPDPRPRLLRALAALAIGFGLAAVLLVPQLSGLRGIDRTGAGGVDALDALHAILVPYPLAETQYWGAGSRFRQYHGQVYYAGSVFTLFWSAGLVVAWIYPRRVGRLLRSPLFTLGLVALLLCVGDPGVLWYAQAKLPMFNKFSHPVKLLPFFHFFSLAAGAVVVHRLTSRSRSAAKWRALCFVVVSVLLAYHVSLVRRSWDSFADRPYPAMPRALDRILGQDAGPVRVMAVPSTLSLSVDFPLGLADNYGTVYGIDSFSGFDPLVSSRPEYQRVERLAAANLLDTLRRYGVTHLVLHAGSDSSRLRQLPGLLGYQERKFLYRVEPLRGYCANRRPCYEDQEIRVFLLDKTEPKAFCSGDCTQPFLLSHAPSAVIVDASGLPGGGQVVINYLWHRAIRLFADGHRIPASADDFGRIVTTVPPGTRTLAVRYQSPWLVGLALGATLTAMGVAIAWLAGQDRPAQRDAS
ncbi:MAG TPA: hypothetical protein VMY37_27365 [Thermoguttaceae bacterium]|nr:hypothetical protein [Thermoguttaceae bacterium]